MWEDEKFFHKMLWKEHYVYTLEERVGLKIQKSSKNIINMQMIQTEYEKPSSSSSSSSFQHFAGTLQVVEWWHAHNDMFYYYKDWQESLG